MQETFESNLSSSQKDEMANQKARQEGYSQFAVLGDETLASSSRLFKEVLSGIAKVARMPSDSMHTLTRNRANDGNGILCIGMERKNCQSGVSHQHHPEKDGYNANENEGAMPKVQPERIFQAPS